MSDKDEMTNAEKRARMAKVWLGWILSFFVFELYSFHLGTGSLSTMIRRFFRISEDKEPLKFSVRAYWLWIIIIVLTIHFTL